MVVEWNIPRYLGDSSGVEKGMDVVFDGKPRLGESVGCVVFRANVAESDETCGDCFTNTHNLTGKMLFADLGCR